MSTNTRRSFPVALALCLLLAGGASGAVDRSAAVGDKASVPQSTVLTWGRDREGQLGDGVVGGPNVSGPLALDPQSLPPDVRAVAGGGYHSLALTRTGSVYAWGENWDGQLGIGTSGGPLAVPQLVDLQVLPLGDRVEAVAAGYSHNLAVTRGGRVLAWGADRSGQLGNGSDWEFVATPRFVRITGLPTGDKVTAVAAGAYHSVVSTRHGRVYAWGQDWDGQLGDGAAGHPSVAPQAVVVPSRHGHDPVTAVAAGYLHTLALTWSGRVFAWGDDRVGQLGDGSAGRRSATPQRVDLSMMEQGDRVIAIAAGQWHSLALTKQGRVYAWGDDWLGQLGDGNPGSPSATPRLVVNRALTTGTRITAIAAGYADSLAFSNVGEVYVWGDSEWGQRGDGSRAAVASPRRVDLPPVAPGLRVIALTAGFDHLLVAAGEPVADLTVLKFADKHAARPGEEVTFKVVVENRGPVDATDVTVVDVLEPGLTFRSSSTGNCHHSQGTVTCHFAELWVGGRAEFTIRAQLDADQEGPHGHLIEVTKTEAHLSVQAGQTGTATADCPAGYFATDGSVRIDHVDQGTGTFADLVVTSSHATGDGTGWTGTIRNGTRGQAQAKVNVVCLYGTTTSGESHRHQVDLGPEVTADGVTGVHELTCPFGRRAVAPGYALTSGSHRVSTRETTDGWAFDLGDARGSVSIRCLAKRLATTQRHGHDLTFTDLEGSVTVGAGDVAELSLTCPVDFKGITAWTELQDGLVPLGTDPQPITRLWRFFNPTSQPLTANYGLVCLNVRSKSSSVRNVVSASARTPPDPDPFNNTAAATVYIRASSKPASLLQGENW